MDYQEILSKRRSCRVFTDEDVSGDDVRLLLRAALMSPTSRSMRSWQFVVVDDKQTLEKLSDAKENGSAFLRQVALAVVVLGNNLHNDCWVEDGAIAAVSMQYQAEELGLGSCWVQIRGRRLSDGTESERIVRGILNIPEDMQVLCIVGFGHKTESLPPHSEEELKWENIHIAEY